jgi:hypothetical protein
MKRLLLCLIGGFGGVLLWACYDSSEVEPTDSGFEHPRKLYFSLEDPDYDNYEGTLGKNACNDDNECLKSGCDDSTCAAENIEIDDKEFCDQQWMSQAVSVPFGSCGCINHACQWYYEDDYDRECKTNDDCNGLGRPPGAIPKTDWICQDNACRFGDDNWL